MTCEMLVCGKTSSSSLCGTCGHSSSGLCDKLTTTVGYCWFLYATVVHCKSDIYLPRSDPNNGKFGVTNHRLRATERPTVRVHEVGC